LWLLWRNQSRNISDKACDEGEGWWCVKAIMYLGLVAQKFNFEDDVKEIELYVDGFERNVRYFLWQEAAVEIE